MNHCANYVNTIESKITFKIKNGYSLELLTPETIKLCGSTKNKITEYKSGENTRHLKIMEVVLIHCNIANDDINKIQEYCTPLFRINRLAVY